MYICFLVIVGAGLEVGKSCVVVTMGGKNIMFDCGMHMGYNDERRFPDFSLISKCGDFNQVIDCVIITHLYVPSKKSNLFSFLFVNLFISPCCACLQYYSLCFSFVSNHWKFSKCLNCSGGTKKC